MDLSINDPDSRWVKRTDMGPLNMKCHTNKQQSPVTHLPIDSEGARVLLQLDGRDAFDVAGLLYVGSV